MNTGGQWGKHATTHVEARGEPEGLVFFHHVGIVTEFRWSDLGQAHLLAEPSPRPHYDT